MAAGAGGGFGRGTAAGPAELVDLPCLGEWAPQWDHLVDTAPLPSPFLRSWWLESAGGPRRHFLLAIRGEQLAGGLALEENGAPWRFQMMGDGALCPDHLDLLARRGDEDAVRELLREWFSRPGMRVFDLRGLRDGSALVTAVPGGAHTQRVGRSPFTPLPDSPASYRATLDPKFRRGLRSAASRLAAAGVAHRAVMGPDVPAHLDALRALHRAQWGAHSHFLSVFDRFEAGCARGCAAGEVVVHELAVDDFVVASLVTFEVAGRTSLYQIARRTGPRWSGAGKVLFAAAIEDACARGAREVDFLRGEEPYKSQFVGAHKRELQRVTAGTGLLGRVRVVATAATSHASHAFVRGVRLGRAVAGSHFRRGAGAPSSGAGRSSAS